LLLSSKGGAGAIWGFAVWRLTYTGLLVPAVLSLLGERN
jgi:hypothetical protein